MSTVTRKPWTADELARLPEGWRYEIDQGELVIMSPAGRRHHRIVSSTAALLTQFVRRRRLGEVDTGEVGIYLHRDAPTVLRAVDIAFYSHERIRQIGDEEGIPDVPPDLAVEVHLPDERDMQRKVRQYLEAGVHAVWVLDPRQGTLTQHRRGQEPVVTGDPDATIREPILPGFECRLRELFGEQ